MRFKQLPDTALLLLRLAFGGLMLYGHGWGKMLRLFGDEPIKFADPFGAGPTFSLGLAVFAEVICSLLVMAGLFTRWAVIPLIITMFVACFVIHIEDPFSRMEKSILYMIPYIAILLAGPGKYSLDAVLFKNK